MDVIQYCKGYSNKLFMQIRPLKKIKCWLSIDGAQKPDLESPVTAPENLSLINKCILWGRIAVVFSICSFDRVHSGNNSECD